MPSDFSLPILTEPTGKDPENKVWETRRRASAEVELFLGDRWDYFDGEAGVKQTQTQKDS